ncbi:MAG: ComEC/Rec2 family competence protein [Candidatus Symbiothrix sp.]|jgi:competence protein ComEC|nr:ComEC/Rec2 family competence protein [Candidatus Symbiothrix sp.]
MKFLQQSPFIRLFMFFLCGSVTQHRTDVSAGFVPLTVGAVLLAGVSFIPVIQRKWRWRGVFGMGLGLGLFACGGFVMQLSQQQSAWTEELTSTHLYEAIVIDDPVLKPKSRMCRVEIRSADDSIYQHVVGKKAVLYLALDSLSQTVVVGNRLFFYANLEAAPPYLREFAATGFVPAGQWLLKSAGALHTTPIRFMGLRVPESSSGQARLSRPAMTLPIMALNVRRALLEKLQEIVPNHAPYGLAAAMMFGDRSDVETGLKLAFANIGAAHILAISGTHFTILFGMLYYLLSFVGNSRRAKILKHGLMLPLIWGFAFMTGFSPSVFRAALMMSLWAIGDAFSFRSLTLNTVAIAAFFMLLYEPVYLFDVGFQLSFLAVISIVLINPHLVKLYQSRNPVLNYVWELCCVSISAQLGVLPLTVYYFHQFPVLFLATNLLLLPLSTIIIGLIPATLLMVALVGNFSLISLPLNGCLNGFVAITRTLDAYSYHNINGIFISVWEMFAWSAVIVLFLLIVIKKTAHLKNNS